MLSEGKGGYEVTLGAFRYICLEIVFELIGIGLVILDRKQKKAKA